VKVVPVEKMTFFAQKSHDDGFTKYLLQFRVITLSFTIYIHKSHSTSDTSLELFFKLRVEHEHLDGIWFQQLPGVHWDSRTTHYKFLLLVPIKLTPSVLRQNDLINAQEKVHVYL
jgi:hypothetical protein